MDLYRRHERGLVEFCLHLTGSVHAAADLAQQTWCKLLAAPPAIQTNFAGFIAKVAAHDWLNEQKRVRRLRAVAPPERLAADSPTESVERTERRALLRRALERLDERTRACVVLRLAHHYKLREVAALLDVSAARCKQLLDNGLEAMRRFLGEEKSART